MFYSFLVSCGSTFTGTLWYPKDTTCLSVEGGIQSFSFMQLSTFMKDLMIKRFETSTSLLNVAEICHQVQKPLEGRMTETA